MTQLIIFGVLYAKEKDGLGIKKEEIMFTNRRIKAALGRTINLGNFESLRIDVEISADIPDGKELGLYQEDLFNEVKVELEERIEEINPKPSKSPRGRIPHE